MASIFIKTYRFASVKRLGCRSGCVVVVTLFPITFVHRHGGLAMLPSPLCSRIVVFEFYHHKNQWKIIICHLGGSDARPWVVCWVVVGLLAALGVFLGFPGRLLWSPGWVTGRLLGACWPPASVWAMISASVCDRECMSVAILRYAMLC